MNEQLLIKAKEMFKTGEQPLKEVYIIRTEENIKRKNRLGITSTGEVLLMRKGSHKKGEYLKYFNDIIDIIPIEKKPKSKNELWEKSINKAIKILEKSKLWDIQLNDLKIALSIGYEKLQEADKIYWSKDENLDYEQNNLRNKELIKAIDNRLIKKNIEENKEFVDTSILCYMSNPLKIKKMYFGKYRNEEYLKQIREAIQNKTKISINAEANYDVSFEYEPLTQKAWYSEEFKGCGNGHYYLALSDEYALFYEDD